MEPSEYITCEECKGVGGFDPDSEASLRWDSPTVVECRVCDGVGHVVNPEHIERCKYHLRELLDSTPFLEEVSNANYHSAVDFLAELRDNEW